MANFQSIAAVGRSIQRVLNHAFVQQQPIPNKTTKALLVRTEDMRQDTIGGAIIPPALSLFLYRVDFNKTMRAAWAAVGSQNGRMHLPLDLHFLLIPWAENAEYEHSILGRALECLENRPILTGPLLDPLGEWSAQEAVQLSLAELSTEEVMRTFDSLPIDYKLSVAYVARVIRIDGQSQTGDRPVTTLATGVKPSVEA